MDKLIDNMAYDADPQREDLEFIQNDLQAKYPKESQGEVDYTKVGVLGQLGQSLNKPDNKIDLYEENTVDNSLLYDTLNSGERVARYDSYLDGYGEEERQAKMQGAGSQWLNGTIKNLGGKVATGIIGGTLGTAYGVIKGLATGNTDALFDNEFTDYLDDLNTRLDYKLPNYYTEAEKEKGFLGSLGEANFWANDLFGGLSFTVSTIVSEGIWAAATGGTSLISSAARVGARGFKTLKGIDKVTDVGKAIKKATEVNKRFARRVHAKKYADKSIQYAKNAELANTARFTYTSAGYEAGMEARMFKKEQEEAFEDYYKNNLGRTPNADEIASFNKELGSATNTVFATNLALVGSSNLAIFGKAFGIKSPFKAPKSVLSKKLFGKGEKITKKTTEKGQEVFEKAEAIKRTNLQKGLGLTKSIFKAPITEGVIEEGGQAVVSGGAENYLNSTYDINAGVLSTMESFYEAMSHTYGTKEGWKEIGLGMLIGAIGGAGSNALSKGEEGSNAFSRMFSAPKEALKDYDSFSEQKASVMNRYMSEKAMDNLLTANNIANAQKYAEEEVAKGNLSRASLYDNMAIMAQVMQAQKYGFEEEAFENMKAYMDSRSVEFYKEQGIEESGIEEYKAESLREYKKRQEDFSKAKEYADYIIADQGTIEIEDNKGNKIDLTTEKVKNLIAYQMVMSGVSESISNDILSEIKNTIGEIAPNISDRLNTLLELQDKLQKATKKQRKVFYSSQKKLKTLALKIKSIEKKRDNVKSTVPTEKNNKALASELNKLNNQLNSLNKEFQESEAKISEYVTNVIGVKTTRGNLNTAQTLNDLVVDEQTTDVLTDNLDTVDVDMLMNMEASFDRLQEVYDALEDKDPLEATKLRMLIDEYKDSLNTFKRFNETALELTNKKTGLKKVKAWYSGKEQINEHTLKVLKNLRESASEQNNIDNIIFNEKEEVDSTKPPKPDDPKNKTKQNKNTQNQSKKSTQKSEKTPLEKLREKLKSILNVNSYTAENYGDNIESKKPTQSEVDRYEELYDKFEGKSIAKVKGDAPQSTLTRYNLTQEEAQELEDLHKKLTDWRVISQTSEDGITIANIIAQIKAYEEANAIPQEQTPEITEEEHTEVLGSNVRDVSSKEKNDSNLGQNYDTVVVTQKGGKVHISHLKPDVLDKNNVDYETDKAGRIIIDADKLQEVLDLLGMKIVDFPEIKSSRWSYAFTKKGDVYVPSDSDFKILGKGSDNNRLSSESIYEMKPGEDVYFSMDTNDAYNNENFKERALRYNSMTGKEEKAFMKELVEQISVYITNKDGVIVSQLKRLTDTNSNPNFLEIRKVAAKKFIDYYNTMDQDTLATRQVSSLLEDVLDTIGVTSIQLPFTTTVSEVMVGIPNIEVVEDENGNLKPVYRDIPEQAHERVIGYGYVEEGELTLNENSKVNGKVNKRYARIKGKKVPVIIVREGNQNIAYPVIMKPTETDAAEQINTLLAKKGMSRQEKLPLLIQKVKEIGLNPEDYNLLDIGSESFFGSQGAKKLREDILNLKRPMSFEKMLNKNTKKSEFLGNATTNLKMEERLFRSPRLKVNIKEGLEDTSNFERMSIEEIEAFERNGFVADDRMMDIINKKSAGEQLTRPELGVYSLYKKIIDREVENKNKLSTNNKNKSTKQKKVNCKK